MRIALVTESFLPDANGVANSVARTAEHLQHRGHEPLVVAPQPPLDVRHVTVSAEVVHLASPFVLGAWGAGAAKALKLSAVAVYQTDVAAYARVYRVRMTEGTAWRWIRTVHNSAARTLVPSSESAAALAAHGVQNVHMWRRGIDDVRFHPRHRSAGPWRPTATCWSASWGGSPRRSRWSCWPTRAGCRGVRLVVVGDGPAAVSLRRCLPDAVFVGVRHGAQLARLYASFDVFAHTGPYETFAQAVQEAMASRLPVVAPATGGPIDLVHHGRTRFLVPPFEAAGFTDAIRALADEPGLRREFGTAGRTAVEGRSWSAVGDCAGYLRAGHEAVLVIPGERPSDEATRAGSSRCPVRWCPAWAGTACCSIAGVPRRCCVDCGRTGSRFPTARRCVGSAGGRAGTPYRR